ncbi:MAG: glycosyltransferase family 25 protein [Epsilonproteobacteria bacterium]|nr:glycosyltransferase family 25 protein [Campylobacterota bacterium]
MQNVKIFVINLKKDVQKRKNMEKVLQGLNLEFEFIDAVYGKDLSNAEINSVYDENLAIEYNGRPMSKAEIGCMLSHLSIYKKVLEDNIQNTLILEDDVQIDGKILDVFNNIKSFPKDWECVLLSYYKETYYKKKYCINYSSRNKISDNLKVGRFISPMISGAGYIINKAGARTLLNATGERIKKPIDRYTGDETYVNLYGIMPKIVSVDPYFGEQSNLELERSHLMGYYKENNKSFSNVIRKYLKKFYLFQLFKTINIFRQFLIREIEQIIFIIKNFQKCIKKPQAYENKN